MSDFCFRFAYASFGDESNAECKINQKMSVILYPTTLQTKFVPAFFRQASKKDQRISHFRSKRQVSSVLDCAVLLIFT